MEQENYLKAEQINSVIVFTALLCRMVGIVTTLAPPLAGDNFKPKQSLLRTPPTRALWGPTSTLSLSHPPPSLD